MFHCFYRPYLVLITSFPGKTVYCSTIAVLIASKNRAKLTASAIVQQHVFYIFSPSLAVVWDAVDRRKRRRRRSNFNTFRERGNSWRRRLRQRKAMLNVSGIRGDIADFSGEKTEKRNDPSYDRGECQKDICGARTTQQYI